MIHLVFSSRWSAAGEFLCKALERSFTRGQVEVTVDGFPRLSDRAVAVVIEPGANEAERLIALAKRSAKILLLGALNPEVAAAAGIVFDPRVDYLGDAVTCAPSCNHSSSESAAAICYRKHGLAACSPLRERRFCRFDFANEWNNLGYGRIDILTGDPWSLAGIGYPKSAVTVADLMLSNGEQIGAAATLFDTPTSAILWFARRVGPIDGADWRVVECFISDYRAHDLPCRPHLRDIPDGFAGAVTARLDCDEEIASAHLLFDFYHSRQLPLSVAVTTDQLKGSRHIDFLRKLEASGGSILSHSASHPPNWGGSAERAEAEARASKACLEFQLPGLEVRYAVSPFHQNPPFVPVALARAGLKGFIAGTIANDPEFLMARGGSVPYGCNGVISHSQSCMLHGDCLLGVGDPIRIYRKAFRIAREGGQFFGYFDHPFSERYSYGWDSEQDRVSTHAAFIAFMRAECASAGGRLLFVNEETCLDFMSEKAATEIAFDENQETYRVSHSHAAGLPLSIGYHGAFRAADND